MSFKKFLYITIPVFILLEVYGLSSEQPKGISLEATKGLINKANAGDRPQYFHSFEGVKAPEKINLFKETIEGLSAGLSKDEVFKILELASYDVFETEDSSETALHIKATLRKNLDATHSNIIDNANIQYEYYPTTITDGSASYITRITYTKESYAAAKTGENIVSVPAAEFSRYHGPDWPENLNVNEILDMINRLCHPDIRLADTLCNISYSNVHIEVENKDLLDGTGRKANFTFKATPTKISKILTIM